MDHVWGFDPQPIVCVEAMGKYVLQRDRFRVIVPEPSLLFFRCYAAAYKTQASPLVGMTTSQGLDLITTTWRTSVLQALGKCIHVYTLKVYTLQFAGYYARSAARRKYSFHILDRMKVRIARLQNKNRYRTKGNDDRLFPQRLGPHHDDTITAKKMQTNKKVLQCRPRWRTG